MHTATVSLFEAKTHFFGLINDVMNSGKEITITRRGKNVAKLVPISAFKKRMVSDVIQDIKALRKEMDHKNRLTLKEIQTMKEEGRR